MHVAHAFKRTNTMTISLTQNEVARMRQGDQSVLAQAREVARFLMDSGRCVEVIVADGTNPIIRLERAWMKKAEGVWGNGVMAK